MTVDRDILIVKLQKIGINDTEDKWMKSYMSDRQQQVVVFDTVSAKIDVNMELPEGTVLASLLFILYINYIKSCSNHTKVSLFAYDALLMIADRHLENAMRRCRKIWLCERLCIKKNNGAIQRENVSNYLGIMIDEN